MDDRYLTIAKSSTAQTKVRGSRFIARTIAVETVEAALEQLEQIRKLEHAATHNCYAYVVGLPGSEPVFKYSDDGEPNGTAGRPIHDIIAGNNLTNVLVVVTRYFGGTKLGTGGLARAYSEAARAAIESSGVSERFVTDRFKVTIDFPVYDGLLKVVHRLGAATGGADFSERVVLELEIRRSMSELLVAEITELSKGRALIEQI